MKIDRRSVQPQLPGSIRRDVATAFAIAIAICLLRLAAFDFDTFFRFKGVVNHDTLSAASMFASSMHALRLDGAVAWWLPGADGGYAQYYNFFLSPLAPTAGNPPFLVWVEAQRLLGLLGVVVPEYVQFLWFNYVLMPVLAYAALLLLCRRFCAGWVAPAVAGMAYAFGGPGLWNNSWMFYQEWANLFFLLWAADIFARRASLRSLAVLAISLIFVAASLNYWTIFSSWFILLWLGFHSWYFRPQWKQALSWLWALRGDRIVIVGSLVTAIVCVLWIATIGLVLVEESPAHTRRDYPLGNNYSYEEVYSRSDANGIRGWTSELFNPVVERPIQHYKAQNEIHNARYIGIGLLPLLLIFFTRAAWRRSDRLLFSMFVALVSICLVSGIFMALRSLPGFSVIVHIFYFYQYFLQIVLILIAARMLDLLIFTRAKSNVAIICALSGGVALAGIIYIFMTSEQYQAFDVTLKSIGFASVLLGTSALILSRLGLSKRASAATPLALLFLLLMSGDMLHYYTRGSLADQAFTQSVALRNLPPILPEPIQAALASTWSVSEPLALSGGLLANLPVKNSLWPDNNFNLSLAERSFRALPEDERAAAQVNVIAALAHPELRTTSGLFDLTSTSVIATIADWHYNSLDIDIVDAADGGLLVTGVAYDAGWRVRVDGKPVVSSLANAKFLAFPITPGQHSVEMVFEPLSQKLYSIARLATLLVLVWLLYLACSAPRRSAILIPARAR